MRRMIVIGLTVLLAACGGEPPKPKKKVAPEIVEARETVRLGMARGDALLRDRKEKKAVEQYKAVAAAYETLERAGDEAYDAEAAARVKEKLAGLDKTKAEDAFRRAQKAKGLVLYEGKWITHKEKYRRVQLSKGLVEYRGKWVTLEEKKRAEMKAKGLVEHEGKWITPEQKKYLQRKGKGLVEYKGGWVTPKAKKRLDGLFARAAKLKSQIGEMYLHEGKLEANARLLATKGKSTGEIDTEADGTTFKAQYDGDLNQAQLDQLYADLLRSRGLFTKFTKRENAVREESIRVGKEAAKNLQDKEKVEAARTKMEELGTEAKILEFVANNYRIFHDWIWIKINELARAESEAAPVAKALVDLEASRP